MVLLAIDDPRQFLPSDLLTFRLERLYPLARYSYINNEMIARGERTAAQMHLNAEADQRFLKVLIANRLEEFDTWNQSALVAEAGIGSMELHTWIAGAAAHKIAGGNPPELSFYSVTPELGIAAGVVHGE